MKNESISDAKGPLQRPRSPRVPVNFSLVVAGTSTRGEPFEINAAAVKVSRGGATVMIDVEVADGDRVVLTPPFGRKLDARVNGVWVDDIDGKQRIGVALLDADGWFAE